MKLYKIYCLIDPRTDSIFYVGATKVLLRTRLSGHISDSKLLSGGAIFNRRSERINEIINIGNRPVIKLLGATSLEKVDRLEAFFYKKYLRDGHDLLQSPDKFFYSKINKQNPLTYG